MRSIRKAGTVHTGNEPVRIAPYLLTEAGFPHAEKEFGKQEKNGFDSYFSESGVY